VTKTSKPRLHGRPLTEDNASLCLSARTLHRGARATGAAKKAGATLVIAKLDRLATNVALVSKLMETKVEFVAVDMPIANRLTIHINYRFVTTVIDIG
jgi:DNA invertase Pin-like site-specific DNA recombinase